MSTGATPTPQLNTISSATERWDTLLKAQLRDTPGFTEHFYERLHAEKLTFGRFFFRRKTSSACAWLPRPWWNWPNVWPARR